MKKEESKKEAKKEDGAAPGAGGEHADADQDKGLIMDMLKKYVGDGFSDEDKQMAHEAYEAAMEACGGDQKEAMQAAGYHMKMAKHMQAKAKQADMAPPAMGEKAADPQGVDSKAAVPATQEVSGPAYKESEKTVVALTGRVAFLEAQLAAAELEKHIDKKLMESRLPMAATKKLREAIKGTKTIKEFDEKLALFKEAFSVAGEGNPGFVLNAEKSNGGAESGLSFADCKRS